MSTERIEVGEDVFVLIFTTGSLWHWEIEGVRETGSSDTRDGALYWAGWWHSRRQSREDAMRALSGGATKR